MVLDGRHLNQVRRKRLINKKRLFFRLTPPKKLDTIGGYYIQAKLQSFTVVALYF